MQTMSNCQKQYVGRSARPLRTRVDEHRRSFYKLCDNEDYDEESGEYALGLHLFSDHKLILTCVIMLHSYTIFLYYIFVVLRPWTLNSINLYIYLIR